MCVDLVRKPGFCVRLGPQSSGYRIVFVRIVGKLKSTQFSISSFVKLDIAVNTEQVTVKVFLN